MADADRTATRAVALYRTIEDKPYRFDFFQVLRRLECVHRDKPKLGRSLRPVDDPIRLTQRTSLTFAPATVSAFEPGKGGTPPRLESCFFGLFGPNGPLPLHLTEYVRDRLKNHHDATLARFADLFHHRLLALFYRAWADVRPTVSYDRPDEDRFALYVGSLAGLGTPALRSRDAWPHAAKLHVAGLLACQTRHADGLESILRGFFRVPAEIETFVGHWMELPPDAWNRLDGSPGRGALGTTAMLGTSVWERQQRFRVVMGPLSLGEYRRLLPGTESHSRLVALVRNYIGFELIWDLKLVLSRTEVPPCRLDGSAQLGWTSWIHGQRVTRHAGDLVLTPSEAVA